MRFEFSSYSSILLIFFSQGIVFSFLLLRKAIVSDSKPSGWLGVFVFLCSLYLLPWMLGFAGWYAHLPYRDIMFYVPFQQLFLIGPSIYFYTQSLLNPSFSFRCKDWFHLTPAILYLAYRVVVLTNDKIVAGEYYFYSKGRDLSLDTWYQVSGFSSMIIYFLLSLRIYAGYKKLIYQTLSFADDLRFNWIRKYLVAFLIMQLLWLIFFMVYPNWGNFTAKWWYFIGFSTIMYYIGFSGYVNNEKAFMSSRVANPGTNPFKLLQSPPLQIGFVELPGEITISNDQPTVVSPAIEEWKLKIASLIETEFLYQDPGLTLADLAVRLSSHQTNISRMINQGFGISFNDFINNYRVRAVMGLIANGEHRKQTLMGIAFDCGFNSKTTFNRCFKKYTKLTPKEYVANYEKQNSGI